MLSTTSSYLRTGAVLLYLASFVLADYWRYNIREYTCIEPREWETDHVRSTLNVVTRSQNFTNDWIWGDATEGTINKISNAWQDITLSDNDPDLTITHVMYNAGDGNEHELAIKIASLVLELPKRLGPVGVVATAVDLVLGIFEDAYKCEGPVAAQSNRYTRDTLESMTVGQPDCRTESYSYHVSRGCQDINPFTTKESDYQVTFCLERFLGESTADGAKRVEGTGSKRGLSMGLLMWNAVAVGVWTILGGL